MKRSPLLATIIVVFFLVAVPIMLISRLTDGLFPTQAYDVVLAVGVVAWILVSKAILDRNDPMDKLIENRLSPTWQANSLVEQSLLGVGVVSKKMARNAEPGAQLHRLQAAEPAPESVMPPVVDEPKIGRDRAENDGDSRPRLQPTLRQNENAAPPILATEEYVVVRGDTFWSIAEQRLGDGRRWKQVEEINQDREVAPGIFFNEGDAMRIGWSLLVPLAEVAESVA